MDKKKPIILLFYNQIVSVIKWTKDPNSRWGRGRSGCTESKLKHNVQTSVGSVTVVSALFIRILQRKHKAEMKSSPALRRKADYL